MQKKTIFVIAFFLISIFLLFSCIIGDLPVGGKTHLPEPKSIDINGITFSIPWGFIEDKDSYDSIYKDTFLNHTVTKEERTFHQNDILLLDIKVYDFKDKNFTFDELNKLNDGSYDLKSINGIEGIFKTEPVEINSAVVKNNHQRYYFNYIKDNKLVMIQCDVINTLYDLVK